MDFDLTTEQQLLRDGLCKYLAARYDLRSARAGGQPGIWRGFAEEIGILGATLPESAGGSGGGPVEAMVIAEELGRAGVIEPWLETAVVCGGLLARAGGDDAAEVLAAIAGGSAVVALAATDGDDAADSWETPSTTAVRDGDTWMITGAKTVVVAAPLATHLLITARTGYGVSLFLTGFDAAAPPAGCRVHGYRTIDDRHAADLIFDQLRLPAGALIAEDARPSLDLARDQGAAAVCAEAVGAMRTVLADTVAYCKQRRQFGQPISGFQVLQHRMVDMYMELEQAVAAGYLATLHLDAPDSGARARAVSAAKVTVGRAARFVGQNAVQLHGGMGMTEELAIGHFFKRLTALQYEFGSAEDHRTRYARLTR